MKRAVRQAFGIIFFLIWLLGPCSPGSPGSPGTPCSLCARLRPAAPAALAYGELIQSGQFSALSSVTSLARLMEAQRRPKLDWQNTLPLLAASGVRTYGAVELVTESRQGARLGSWSIWGFARDEQTFQVHQETLAFLQLLGAEPPDMDPGRETWTMDYTARRVNRDGIASEFRWPAGTATATATATGTSTSTGAGTSTATAQGIMTLSFWQTRHVQKERLTGTGYIKDDQPNMQAVTERLSSSEDAFRREPYSGSGLSLDLAATWSIGSRLAWRFGIDNLIYRERFDAVMLRHGTMDTESLAVDKEGRIRFQAVEQGSFRYSETSYRAPITIQLQAALVQPDWVFGIDIGSIPGSGEIDDLRLHLRWQHKGAEHTIAYNPHWQLFDYRVVASGFSIGLGTDFKGLDQLRVFTAYGGLRWAF